jgi:glucokinase
MRHAIGIDVGGTKISAAIVELDTCRLLHRREIATNAARGGEAVLDAVRGLLNDLGLAADMHRLRIEAVGLGICEIVGPDGRLHSASLIDWRDLNPTSSPQGLPSVHLVSDVRAAALAEARFGAARQVRDALYVSVGTGIGSVLLIEGRPYAGAHGAALVLATAAPVPIGSGPALMLEEIASGRALARQFSDTGGDARIVIAAALRGDPRAHAMVAEATSLLGAAIAQLANCLDPSVIVIGGGLGSAPGPYFESLRERITDGIWKGLDRQIDVRRAMLGADAGLAGAALAADLRQR